MRLLWYQHAGLRFICSIQLSVTMDPNRPPSRDLSAYSYGSVVNRDDNGNIDVSGVTLDTMVSRGIPKEAIREKYEQTIRDYRK